MPHPTWLAYFFAAVMVAVSLYCIGRLALADYLKRRNHYDVNVAHVLMGFAMVGMLVPRWNVIPVVLWEIVFGVLAVYFAVQSVRFVAAHGWSGSHDHHVHTVWHWLVHMVMSCAMLYMYWLGMPMSSSSAGSAMGMSGPPHGAGDPGLTLLLIVVLTASAVWSLDALGRFAPRLAPAMATLGGGGSGGGTTAAGRAERPFLAPRLEAACHVAMCLTMAYMLVLMV